MRRLVSVPSGGINEAKKRLIALIGLAEPSAHVYGNWRLAMEDLYSPKTGMKLPVVTVRISPARITTPTYGRLIPESGDMGAYSFSAHCFTSACTASGEERYKHAHDLADRIVKYLSMQNWNSAQHIDHPIADVYDMQPRESEPERGSKKEICRVIIEGVMLVKRKD